VFIWVKANNAIIISIMKKIITFVYFFLILYSYGLSQIGIGTIYPHPSAEVEIKSNDKGFLAPRISLIGTNDQQTISSPATGLLIYNTATAGNSPNEVTPGYYQFNGQKWIKFLQEQPQEIVDINTTDPNDALTTFDPNAPQSFDHIYVSSENSSLWIWNGSSYVTYTPPASTPFYISNTTTDAGNNKTSSIWRNGRIGIGTNTPQTALDVAASAGTSAITIGTPGIVNTEQVVLNFATRYNRINPFGTGTNIGWQIGARGNTFTGSPNTFHASYWNGTAMNQLFTILNSGNVGIKGITNPLYALDINGATLIRSGNAGGTFVNNQLLLGLSNQYMHSIKSRHSGSQDANNAIDFFIWKQGVDATTTIGTKQIMSLVSNGNVGIGTTAPDANLEIISPLIATTTINTDANFLKFVRPTSNGGKWGHVAQFNLGSYSSGGPASTRLDLSLNDLDNLTTSPIMTWQGNGNVGIGMTSPLNKLVVRGLNNQPSALGASQTNAILRIEGETNHTLDFGTLVTTPYGGYIQSHNKAATTVLPLLLNPNSGNVGIGMLNPLYKLDVAGDINASGVVRSNGTTLTSDLRLKSNIKPISGGIQKVMSLKPVNYDKRFNLDLEETINENGFIAQEIQKVVPEIVSEGKDEDKLLSVNYNALIPVLTKAIQEQQEIIEDLKKEIELLKELLKELKK
jgi:hypothetical protein